MLVSQLVCLLYVCLSVKNYLNIECKRLKEKC